MMMGKKLVVVVVVVHIIDNKFVCPTIIYTSSRYHTMYVASSTSMVPSAGYPTVLSGTSCIRIFDVEKFLKLEGSSMRTKVPYW